MEGREKSGGGVGRGGHGRLVLEGTQTNAGLVLLRVVQLSVLPHLLLRWGGPGVQWDHGVPAAGAGLEGV